MHFIHGIQEAELDIPLLHCYYQLNKHLSDIKYVITLSEMEFSQEDTIPTCILYMEYKKLN